MPFHVLGFQISNAFSAYHTRRFLVIFAIAKEVLILPDSVKRSLSGIIKMTFFFDKRHSPEIHKFNDSCVEDDLFHPGFWESSVIFPYINSSAA